MTRSFRQIFAYHATVFLSAFLLFQIQPMMAKALLPGFGGSFFVWGACMAFFQAMLIAGYAWAHEMQRRLGVRRYARWHLLVLLAPLLCLGADYAPVAHQNVPLYLEVVRLLIVAVGAPFFALSTTSLILQRWLADSDLPQRDNPYVLYAASNAGSMLALLSYPAVVEPLLTLAAQWRVWWALYGAVIILHALCLPSRKGGASGGGELEIERGIRPTMRQAALWLTLSMAGCAMLLAVTNTITFDVASIPLFWTLPLAVYLSTFVLLFKRRPWNPPWMQGAFDWAVLAALVIYLLMQLRMIFPIEMQLMTQLLFLFIVCMRVHGRLAMSRPADARLLTSYFLTMSVGGFLGSFLVSWVVPMVFSTLIEFPLALMLAAAGGVLHQAWFPAAGESSVRRRPGWVTLACVATVAIALLAVPWGARAAHLPFEATAALMSLPLALAIRATANRPRMLLACLVVYGAAVPRTQSLAESEHVIQRLRNFYGIYTVFDEDGVRNLQHGSTLHGRQSLDPAKQATPLSDFHPSTPAAGVLRENPLGFQNIAMIGLGSGALATYLHAGQRFTIYELDPDNRPIAEKYFTYLKMGREHGATIDFVFGDGRINLRGVPDHTYDLLIVDAFSSDAIPVHLLTIEAFREDFRALKPGGLLMLHISNRYFPLEPLVASLARELRFPAVSKSNQGDVAPGANLTYWTALAKDRATLEPLVDRLGWGWLPTDAKQNLPRAWTDQYSNLLGLLLLRD